MHQRRGILALLPLVYSCHLPEVIQSEASEVVRDLVHVHSDHKWTVEVCVAEELQEMRVRVARELEALALEQQDVQACAGSTQKLTLASEVGEVVGLYVHGFPVHAASLKRRSYLYEGGSLGEWPLKTLVQ